MRLSLRRCCACRFWCSRCWLRRARTWPRSRRSRSPSRTSSPEARRSGQSDRTRSSTGTIEFALDPADHAQQRASSISSTRRAAADRRVHFTADLYVLQPSSAQRATAPCSSRSPTEAARDCSAGSTAARGGSQDPMAAADFGDGFLMREGYTLVWVGWQFDVAAAARPDRAPAANVQGRVRVHVHRRRETD